jgi:hypothetical protein
MHYDTHRDPLLIRHGERGEERRGNFECNSRMDHGERLRSVHGIWTTGASYFVVYRVYGPRERLEDCIFKYHKS